MKILASLKGVGGEFEINRLVGAVGAASYILCSNGFVAQQVFYLGKPFNLTEYCIAFPGGLTVVLGAIAGAVAVKDRNVASAKIISDTGTIPTKPPAGPQTPTEDVK